MYDKAKEVKSTMEATVPDLIKRAAQHRELEEYQKAQECLDKIIRDDPENYLAWYEKSKLPIIQEDTVTVKGRVISLPQYQTLPLAEKSGYLQSCGFEIPEIQEIEERLKVPNLVANERIKYLKMAIRYAPEDVKNTYSVELNGLVTAKTVRSRRYKRAAIIIGLIALPVSVLVALVLLVFSGATFFQNILNIIITVITPYALSVVGMTLYAKAKNNDGATVLGFICNLLALIICNVSIVGAVILSIIK